VTALRELEKLRACDRQKDRQSAEKELQQVALLNVSRADYIAAGR